MCNLYMNITSLNVEKYFSPEILSRKDQSLYCSFLFFFFNEGIKYNIHFL